MSCLPLWFAPGSNGQATVHYTGVMGADLVQATATIASLPAYSNQATVNWVTGVSPTISVSGTQLLNLPNTGTYTATITDPVAPAGGAITVAWTQLSGPSGAQAFFDHPTSLTTDVVYTAPGTYVLQLAATDSFGTSTVPVTVTVTAPVTTDQGWIANPIDGPRHCQSPRT